MDTIIAMPSVRSATPADAPYICAMDQLAQASARRRFFIEKSVTDSTCLIAFEGEQICGYGILDYTFFEHGFIPIVYVHPDFRRQGVAELLLDLLENHCISTRVFTSSASSNIAWQQLLAKRRYMVSGSLNMVRDDEPEVVYAKTVGHPF